MVDIVKCLTGSSEVSVKIVRVKEIVVGISNLAGGALAGLGRGVPPDALGHSLGVCPAPRC